MRHLLCLAALLLTLCTMASAQTAPSTDFDLATLAAQWTMQSAATIGDWGMQTGYGDLAWGTSYALLALDVMYETTHDPRYLSRGARLIEQIFALRDSELATNASDPKAFVDFTRGRVLKSWGSNSYSGGKHTCWFVHAGMLLYPMAKFVYLVRTGGPETRPYRQRAERLLPKIEETLREFDSDWHEGPQPGQGYYTIPKGVLQADILPNNQMNAAGSALFVLYDLTGRPEYLNKAAKMAAFFKSKLNHITDGDYYVWSYWNNPPDSPPGTGEDVSHASINAVFMYVAWEHHASFDDTDMARLTRTVTQELYLGNGEFAGVLGTRLPSNSLTGQIGRWGFLARFDPQVETDIRAYIAAHPGPGQLGGPTGALGLAYLLRAQQLRAADQAAAVSARIP